MIKNQNTLTYLNGAKVNLDSVTNITIKKGELIKNNYMDIKFINKGIDYNLSNDSVVYNYAQDDSSMFSIVNTSKQDIVDEEYISVYLLDTDNPLEEVEVETNLMFNGVINEIKTDRDTTKINLTLKTKDRNVIILNKLAIPETYTYDQQIPTDIIIQRLFRGASNNVPPGAYGFDDSGNQVLNAGTLVDARLFTDGIAVSGNIDSVTDNTITVSEDISNITTDYWIRNTTNHKYAFITKVNGANITVNKSIFSVGDSYEISDGFIQDTRTDGTAFPYKNFSAVDKPAIENIQTLSGTEYTNTADELDANLSIGLVIRRNMRYSIDRKARVHWYYPDDTPSVNITMESQTSIGLDSKRHIVKSHTLTKKIDNTVNFIIFTAGTDFEGDTISGYYRDDFSGTPNEQDSFRVFDSIANNLKEQAYNTITGGYRHAQYIDGNYTYPNALIYPFVPSFSPDGSSVADDTEYNTMFEAVVQQKSKSRASSIIKGLANPRWEGSIKLQGENLHVGDLVDFTDTAYGINDILVRIQEVTHFIDTKASSWLTTIKVEEDEPELIQ